MPRKRIKYSEKSENRLRKLTPIYMVTQYVQCCVLEYPFSGYFKKHNNGVLEPLVYDFDDHNGIYEEWVLRPITDTTIGTCIAWTFYRENAENIASKFNNER